MLLISLFSFQVIICLLLTCFIIVLCSLATVMSGLAYNNDSWSYIGKQAKQCDNKNAGKCSCVHSVSVTTPFQSKLLFVSILNELVNCHCYFLKKTFFLNHKSHLQTPSKLRYACIICTCICTSFDTRILFVLTVMCCYFFFVI